MKTPLVQSPSDLLVGDRQHPIPAPYPMGRAVSGDNPDTAQALLPRTPPCRSRLASAALLSGRLSTNRVFSYTETNAPADVSSLPSRGGLRSQHEVVSEGSGMLPALILTCLWQRAPVPSSRGQHFSSILATAKSI